MFTFSSWTIQGSYIQISIYGGDLQKNPESSSGGQAPCSTGFPRCISVLGTHLYQCTSWHCCEKLGVQENLWSNSGPVQRLKKLGAGCHSCPKTEEPGVLMSNCRTSWLFQLKQREQIHPSSACCSVQVLKGLDDAHPCYGG